MGDADHTDAFGGATSLHHLDRDVVGVDTLRGRVNASKAGTLLGACVVIVEGASRRNTRARATVAAVVVY